MLRVLTVVCLAASYLTQVSRADDLAPSVPATAVPRAPQLETWDIGSRRELFVDGALVDTMAAGASLRLHHPVPRNVAIVHNAPWEGNATAYHSVFQDGERYRMYYRSWNLNNVNGQLAATAEALCYAESDDGITWRKPELGLFEFAGSKQNNIVLSADWAATHNTTVHAPAVFRDDNPAAPADARYKMFLLTREPLGMRPFKSPDGIHWAPLSDGPTITDGAFDSHNIVYWDAERQEYRAYWRYFTGGTTTGKVWKPEGIRSIRTATSKDLLTWQNQADLAYQDSPEEQLYENGVAPYHRAPHLMLGLPVRYIDRGNLRISTSPDDGRDRLTPEQIEKWSPALKALPQFELRMLRARLSERYGSALTEGLLMASRDGARFKRWNEAFLRPGIERPGTWNYGQHLIAWRPVETRSDLEGAPPELSIYTTEGYWTAPATMLRRHTLRLDGFVSLHAPLTGGELLTRPLRFEGRTLHLNLATSAAGTVRVELTDERGDPLPGYTASDCDELFGDTLDRTVTWKGNADVAALSGRSIRLRLRLADADIYAFQFSK